MEEDANRGQQAQHQVHFRFLAALFVQQLAGAPQVGLGQLVALLQEVEAAALVQKMQFFTRLRDEVQQLEADLEDELL